MIRCSPILSIHAQPEVNQRDNYLVEKQKNNVEVDMSTHEPICKIIESVQLSATTEITPVPKNYVFRKIE